MAGSQISSETAGSTAGLQAPAFLPRVGIGFPELLFYAVCLAGCLTIWISSTGSSLWVDETLSFWQINGGFVEIPRRQWMTFPAYSYLLWLDTKLLGTSEVALRIPSLVAMLASARLVYASCRQLLNDARAAYVGLIFFAAHPYIAFLAIDVRPYGFAVLATSLAIYAALKFRGTNSVREGILFGCACGLIIWFHFLFAVIIPGLFVYFVGPLRTRKTAGWRPVFSGILALLVMMLPAVPELFYMFTTREGHVISPAPTFLNLVNVAFPMFLLLSIPLMIVPAEWVWLTRKELALPTYFALIAGVLPTVIMFSISRFSSLHIFMARYTLVAVPGLGICWALLARSSPFKWGGFLLTALLLGLGIVPSLMSHPSDSKYGDLRVGLEFADSRARAIGGPIVLCSQFVESDSPGIPMPTDPKSAKFFSPLSYYRVVSDVVPLPRSLNGRTIELGSRFLEAATAQRRPFVVVGADASRPILDWFAQQASGAFNMRKHEPVGEIYIVAEFTPRTTSK